MSLSGHNVAFQSRFNVKMLGGYGSLRVFVFSARFAFNLNFIRTLINVR
jgi:hypothetical protein